MEQNVSITGALQEAAGIDDRSVLFVPLLFAVYLGTVCLGTAIVAAHTARARKARKAREAREEAQPVAATVLGNPSPTDADTLLSPRPARTVTGTRVWACLSRQRAVQICFSCTYLICMIATVVSLATGTLSKSTGLHWEWYLGLLSLACFWHLLQALCLPKENEYGSMAFAEATLSGMVPFLSDNFDTLKDVMFGGLCWQSERPAVKAMAWLAWLYIPAFHAGLLRKKRVLNELAGHVLSVWTMATETEAAQNHEAERPDSKKDGWCRRMWHDKLLPILYRQTTPTKQQMLLVENAPQAIMAVVYTAAEGGSMIVSILNITVPILQVVGGWALFPRLREAVTPWFVKKLNSSIKDGDDLTLGRMWKEADFQRAPKLLADVANGLSIFDGLRLNSEDLRGERGPRHIQLLKEIMTLATSADTRLALDDRGLRGDAVEFKAVCSFLKKAVFVEKVDLSRNDLGAEQAQALAASITTNGSIVDLKLQGNSFGTAGMQDLAKEALRIRSLRHLNVAGSSMGMVGFQALAETPLESLDVGSNKLGLECAEALTGALCIRRLRHFNAAGNGLGAAGFQALAEAFAGSSLLETLDVGSNDLGPNCTEALKMVLSIATLKDFRADQNALAGALAEAVTASRRRDILRHLSVAGNDLGTAGFQALAEALVEAKTPVETIDVGSNGIGEDGSEALKKLLGTTTLKDFRAAHNALGDAGAKVVAECFDSERCAIERLSLAASGIGTEGFEALGSTERPAAVQLHISGNLMSLEWKCRVQAAADLSRCFQLMDVVLARQGDESTAADEAQEVQQALRDGQAEIFWLRREGCKELAAALQGQSRLQVLHVEGGDVEAVLEALEGHAMLKSLALFMCRFDTKALGLALDGKSGLEELVLPHTEMNPESMKALAPALKGLAALKVLDLGYNRLGDDGAKAMAESFTGMSLLEQLDLQDNKIGSQGVQALAPALKGLATLKSLDLATNDLGANGAKALAPALKGLAALKFLDLGYNRLGDDGAKALAPALKGLTALEVLRLGCNDLGADGAKALTESFTGMSLLEILDLSGNEIRLQGAQALAPALKGLAALMVLDLNYNHIGDAGKKVMKVAVKDRPFLTLQAEDRNRRSRRRSVTPSRFFWS
ncbi:NLRC3 [Symbiodinium sp. CCMP2592]|nr:NLRC3 [Symbiodinium sp. CCMP2592]